MVFRRQFQIGGRRAGWWEETKQQGSRVEDRIFEARRGEVFVMRYLSTQRLFNDCTTHGNSRDYEMK